MTPASEKLRVLIVEDSPDDADLVLLELKRSGIDVDYEVVADFRGAAAALERPWDVVLSDFNLPNTKFSDILAKAREKDADVPVIVVSGAVGEEVAVELLHNGANDLVLKHNLGRLAPSILRELRIAEQNHARRAAERRLQDIVTSTADWVWETDASHKLGFDYSGRELAEWSDPLRRVGLTHWEAVGADPETEPVWAEYRDMLERHQPFRNFRYSFYAPAGAEYHISMSGVPSFTRAGVFTGYRGTATDESLIVATYLRAERAEAELAASRASSASSVR